MPPAFDQAFRTQLDALFRWRRDVRRFRADPLPPGLVERLLEQACTAPSVGLSQPWRFVLVEAPGRRAAVEEDFRRCNADALAARPDTDAALYAGLKLAGLAEAPVHLAVFADQAETLGRGLGRTTMPETLTYSAVLAVAQLWLAARAEGVGMGWVSILDPARVAAVLETPPAWRLVGYFCLGWPEAAADTPELERAGWERRRDPGEVILRR